MTDFPLTRSLGLEVVKADPYHKDMYLMASGPCQFGIDMVRASDLEAILAKSVQVCAHRGPSNPEGVWIAKPYQDRDSTHSALLIAITPLRRERRAELSETDVHSALTSALRNDRTFEQLHADVIERLFGQGTDKGQSGSGA